MEQLKTAIETLKEIPFVFRSRKYAGYSEEEVVEIENAFKYAEEHLKSDEGKRFIYLSVEPITYEKVAWDELNYNENTYEC